MTKLVSYESQMDIIDDDDKLYALSLQREERGTEGPSQAVLIKQQTLEKLATFKVPYVPYDNQIIF